MWLFGRKERRTQYGRQDVEYPIIRTDLEQIKKAVREFEANLTKGIRRTVLITDGNKIDVHLLAPYLHGIPEQNFYMSKHTYELFTEEDKMIPHYLDLVQEAVDCYIEDKGAAPVVPDHRQHKINYDVLMADYYLKEKPPIPMYLTMEENLITHRPQA